MKKFLLSAAIVASAMTANAQQPTMQYSANGIKSIAFKAEEKKPMKSDLKLSNEMVAKTQNFQAVRSQMNKAMKKADFADEYVSDGLSLWYPDCHIGESATISFVDVQDPETNETKKMANIHIGKYIDILGDYDAETNTIHCASQFCGELPDYGKLAIYGLDDETAFLEEFNFNIDENGILELQENGYAVMAPEYSDDAVFDAKTEWQILPINAMSYYQNSDGESEPTEYEVPVAIADSKYSINAYGMFGMSSVGIDINDDMTVCMVPNQNIVPCAYMSSSIDTSIFGDYFFIWGTTAVEQDGQKYWQIDENSEGIMGLLQDDIVGFDQPFVIATQVSEESRWYSLGWFDGLTFQLDNRNFVAAGIKNVENSLIDRVKNSKTYNMMGQQVDVKTAKGLLIRDGKKFIKK